MQWINYNGIVKNVQINPEKAEKKKQRNKTQRGKIEQRTKW